MKVPIISSAVLNLENDDKYCFFWSKLAHLHPTADSKIGSPIKILNNRQTFKELNIEGFDFSNGFEGGDNHNFEKLGNLSIKLFELGV